MRRIVAITLFALAAALAWVLLAEPDGVLPPEPLVVLLRDESPPPLHEPPVAPAPVAANEVVDAGTEASLDAGPSLIDVLVEVFGADGHEPGANISFHGPNEDKYALYAAMRDPNADYGPEVGRGRTDVMGFTHAYLPAGRWRVKPVSEPRYVEITPATRELVIRLKKPNVLRGIVVDEKGNPVAGAEVWVERDVPGAERFRGDGIDLPVEKDGRFAYTTFDDSLTLVTRTRGRKRFELQFRKHVNLPCPEVKLYLGNLATVELDVKGIPEGVPLALRHEVLGIVNAEAISGRSVEVMPGHVTFAARAVVGDQRFSGGADADVKAGETTRVPLEMIRARGQEVHVYDENREPLRQAQVVLNLFASAAVSRTDEQGVALFDPGVPSGRVGEIKVTGRCVLPHPRVTALDDAVTVTATRCAAPDSGVPLDGGYDDRRDR